MHSDSDELIDLTVPRSKKTRKRTREGTAKPKNKLPLAVGSLIDDAASDNDEEAEEEDLVDDDDGFIDMCDRRPPFKSARLVGKTSAGVTSTSVSMTPKKSPKSGSSSKTSRSTSNNKSSTPTEMRSTPSRTLLNEHRENIEGDAGEWTQLARLNSISRQKLPKRFKTPSCARPRPLCLSTSNSTSGSGSSSSGCTCRIRCV